MTELLTSAQMRAIQAAAIDSGRVTGAELMERAGQGAVDAIMARWPELGARPGPVVVLCGPGNNGGDGFVIARLLRDRGCEVAVFLSGAADRLPADAASNLARWGAVRPLSALDWGDLDGAALAIDALFGIGLTRDLAPGIWGALAMVQEARVPLVAIDILSGICADSGRVRAEGGFLNAPADLTVTFQRPKPGHVLDEGGQMSGDLAVVPIGLEDGVDDLLRGPDADAVADTAWPRRARLEKRAGHKFSHGHALVVAGGPGAGGAARLAAGAALRVGAGLVTLAPPPDAMAENAARLDAVMLRAVADAAALADLLADPRITSVCIGPGLGTGPREAALLGAVLASGRPAVLDADALTLLSRDPALRGALHRNCVLTPHGGEFARLFPAIAARLRSPAGPGPAFSRVDAARQAASEAGCTLLLKGADTVIATPDGIIEIGAAVRGRAAPWLATAGSGDVLAGLIAGLMARGFPPLDAASSAAWLHVECAVGFGPGLTAEDIAGELPRVFRALGL